MTRSWFRHRAAAVWFGAACTIISWAGLAAYWGTHQLVRSFNSAAESHQALEKLQNVQTGMEAAESSVDAFVITGNRARLVLFQDASVQIPLQLRQMEALVAAYPAQVKALQPLERMTLGHLSYLRNIVRVRRTRGLAAAASWIATEDDESPRALTRQLLSNLQISKQLDVTRRMASAAYRSNAAKIILTLAALVSLGFLIWAFTLWRRESQERLQAEGERARLHSFLDSIIERIPYMVLVKEARALRVVHANPAAARWLGRSKEALVGANVFDWRPAREAELEARLDRQTLDAGLPTDIPEEPITVEGQTRIFHTQKVVIPDSGGDPAYLVTISEDITERKQAERMLELSRDAAVESARMKAEFLRNMTHEFRTPLSVIIGMSTLLEGTTLEPPQKRFTAAVRKAAEGLALMAKNILDFSKIETGSFQIETEPVPLLETVEGVVRMFSEQASAKGIELTTSFAGNVPTTLWGDRSRLSHVLTQLVGNAIKFTAQGGVCVRVSVARENAQQCWVTCRVTDTGVGVAPHLQEQLFDAFRQGDGSATRRFGGTGLGLAIAKRVIHLMGGDIGFEPLAQQGSTFWFTVPFSREKPAEALEPSGIRALILDENDTLRGRLREQLTLWGLPSQAFPSGEAALARLRREKKLGRPMPVVLVGLHLLDMEGAAFARSLRADRTVGDTTLLALVSPPLEPGMLSSLGFNGCLDKNADARSFYDALAAYVTPVSVGRRLGA